MSTLFYCDDGVYQVELHDRVEVRLDGRTYSGVVRAIHRNEVTVRYEDHRDYARSTGRPRQKTRRFPIAAVELVGRDA